MDDNRILKLVYTFFLGLLLAIFLGVGINTFYSGPKPPQYPVVLNTVGKEPTDQELAIQRDFDTKMQHHEELMKPYNRNVSIISLLAAIVFLAVSLIYEKKIKVIADGVLLGGVFTLLYSLGRSFASGDSKYTFVVVTIGLGVTLYLGYHRFVMPHATQPKSAKTKT